MLSLPCTDGERPRERLDRLGPRALSLEELLTLILGTGSGAASAAALARRILERFGPDRAGGLPRLSAASLRAVPGVGPMTAARVAAALELGRRMATRDPRGEHTRRIRGPEDVFRHVGPGLRDLSHEEFHVLLLGAQHHVLEQVLVTRGILDASLIHPREVFRPAIRAGAAAVIVVHNHPSGDPTPSTEDRRVTRQLREAGRTVGIPLLDHVVVGDGRWASVPPEQAHV